jgi:hypothetical protein
MPQYQVNIPGSGTYRIDSPVDLTNEQVYAAVLQQNPEAEPLPEAPPQSGFMPALKAGFSNLKGDAAALAGRAGIMGLPEAEKYIAEQEAYQKKTFAPTTKGWTEAPFTKIGELAGGSAPYMVAPVVAGLGAAALPVTGLAGTALGLGAAGLTSAAQFTGSNLSRQVDTGKKLGETDLTNAALASIPMAALDTVSMRMIPGLGKMFERAGLDISAKAANDLAKEGIKKTAADYLMATGKTMGTEGLTEAGQQVFERMQAGLNLTDPAARAEYFDNFLGGAVLGGILAPAGRYVERGQEQGQFDKNQREEQKQRILEESQANAAADAELEAKRQTPAFALQAQKDYEAAEQKQVDLQTAIHKGAKNQKLTEVQRQENKEISAQLKEHASVLSDAASLYRKYKQFLPAALPEGLFPEAVAPTTPELNLKGEPLTRAAPETEVEQVDIRRQVRTLEQQLEEYQTANKNAATPQETLALGLAPKIAQVRKALEEARKLAKALPKSPEEQLAVATAKWKKAKELGDEAATETFATKMVELQRQATPETQQEMELFPFTSTVTGDRQQAVRAQYAPGLNLGVEEQEADTRALQDEAEKESAARGEDINRGMRLAPETGPLRKMASSGTPGAVALNEQLGLFGANEGPTTPSSAPLGQMKQILTGEDVTATAPEEGKRQVQRGGEAPFKLLSRREGTEEPLTAEELRQRIDRLQLRDDLSDDAYAFLTRVSNRVPETDRDGILTLIDEQLARIERNEEGFVPKGAGKEALYDAFPVQTPPTSTVTPTLASGKDFGTRTDTEAKALARARAKRYKEVIDKQLADLEAKKITALKPAQAAYQARLVTQEDVEGPFEGRPDEFKAPTGEVKVQKRVDDLAKVRKTGGPREQAATLRGPSATAIEMGMYPDALEQYLRVREDLDAAEQAGQMDLFGEKDVALTRATPAMFQRYLNSAAVKEMRSREKEATQQVAALPEIKKVGQSISELEQKLSSIKSLWETTATAKSILAGNTKAKEALTAYGRLQNDPMFSSILSLSASSKSEEHAQLQESIKVYNNALDDIREQIATTEKLIGKAPKKDNRVKLDILSQQQTKLQSTLNKLDSLKNNAEAAQAAKDHIDSMIAIMAARDTLAKLGKSAPTARDVAQAQSDLGVALNEKRRADAASKAQDELRDTTDRSYATRQKAEEMSAARTRNWNWLHAGDVRRYRALTDEERAAFTSVTADEVQTELAYEQQLNGLKIPQLKMEIGKMDKERAALLKKIDIAKAKSESYLAQAMAEEAAGMNVAQVRAEESRLEMMANQIRGMHGAGGGGSAVREKVAEFRALKQKLDAFYESRKPGKKASLAMYGPKGSIFTKPAFKGVEGFLKQQADLSTRIDAAETRLNELAARATPIMQRQGKDAIREIKPATAEEQDLIGMAEDAADERRASEVKVNALVATMKKQKARGNTEVMAETAKELADARAKLALDSRKLSRRMGSVTTEQSAEPSKLRSGSEESKKIPGVTKTKLSEAPIEKIPTAKQAVAVGNQLAAEKIAAGKKLTKKEVKSMDLAQKTALQAAAFDRLSTLNSQVSGMKQTIANLQQARSDYAAGRRKSFNLDVLKNAEARLAALEKETTKAREQAGVLEDVGEMTAAERSEDAIADMPLGQDLGEEGALYRTKTSEGAGMKEQEVARLADRITANWTTIPEIVVVATEKGLPLHIQKQAERDNMTGKIPGLYDTETKKVYLVAENLHTGEDVALTVAHEIAGHFGLREMLGGEYAVEMNRIYDGNKSVRTTADAKMKANALLSKETAVEEVLADIAETGPTAEQESVLRRIYNLFKRMFARVTGAKYLSDEEVRQVVASARHYVQTGEGGRGGEVAVEKAVFRSADYKSDDALSKTAQRVVAQPKTLLQKVRGKSNAMLEAQMESADMRAGLITALENSVKDPRTMGSTKLFRQAIFSITAADQHMPITQMAATMGPPKMFKDEKGYYEVRSSMENSAIDVFDSVQDIPDSYGNAEAKMGMASMYMIAQRAMNKGLAKLDTGAMGVTEQELRDVMRSVDADPKLKAALEKTRKLYNAYNRGMIEWLASPQVAAISRDDAKAFLKDEDYVPYYRVLPNGNAELVFGGEKTITIGDIKHQPYLAELKGGDSKIMPLNQSVMRNTMLLVTKGMTNMAQKNIAYAMQAAGEGQGKDKTNLMPVHKGQGVADASIIRWTQEPDPNDPKDKGERWLRVQTNDTMFGGIPAELIIKSMEGAHLTLPAFLKLGGMAGDLLRSGVTRTPIYLARQLIRDPFAATATAGLDYGPLTAIFRANKEFLKMTRGQSETGAKLIEKGLVQSGIFDGSPADMEKMALQLAGGKSLSLLGKLFKGADSLAIKADAATRALIYDNAIKNGLSEVEASHAVRESMNFYKRGLSPTVQYASRMIPFFNAQIQGLSVLFKAARGNMPFDEQLNIKRKFINNAMMLTGVGIAYAMAMDDDEYYKNSNPKDRYSNFFLHLPGVDEPVKLPIPYEFGWFFSAGVAAADAIKGEVNTPQQLGALKDMFVGAIPGASNNMYPQIVKPIAEVYANKSFFSGNPLESERLRKLDPEARYNEGTTEMAKWFGRMVPGLSPIQLEHIVSGYLGQLPLMVAASADSLFAKDSSIAEPTRKLSELPLIGSSFQRKYGGEDADVVYKLADEALRAKRTFDDYRSKGKIEDAREYMQDNRSKILVAPMAMQYQKVMGQLRKREEIIRESSLDADAKAKRIEELDKQRQLQSERYMKAIQRAEAT